MERVDRIVFGTKNSPPVICVHSRIGFFIRRFRRCAQIVFEVVVGDAIEAEEEVIGRAVEVVFAVGACEDGAWIVGVGHYLRDRGRGGRGWTWVLI